MKKFALLLVITISVLSCNKDDGDNDNPVTKAFRAKEVISVERYNSDVYEEKQVFFYTGEKVSEAISYDKENGVWLEDYKTVLSYQGDWVSSKWYEKEGNDWVEDSDDTYRIKIINGKVLEVESTYDNEIDRYIYTYSGDKLILLENFENETLYWKEELIYNGDQIQEVKGYFSNNGVLEPEYKSEFTYSEGKLVQVIEYYYSNSVWKKDDKDVYQYSGNQVIQIDDYNWIDNNWEHDDITVYEYNSEGLLVSEVDSYDDGSGSWEQHYTYEAGRGNLKVLWDEESWYDIYNIPTLQKTSGKSKAIGTSHNKQFRGRSPLKRLFH